MQLRQTAQSSRQLSHWGALGLRATAPNRKNRPSTRAKPEFGGPRRRRPAAEHATDRAELSLGRCPQSGTPKRPALVSAVFFLRGDGTPDSSSTVRRGSPGPHQVLVQHATQAMHHLHGKNISLFRWRPGSRRSCRALPQPASWRPGSRRSCRALPQPAGRRPAAIWGLLPSVAVRAGAPLTCSHHLTALVPAVAQAPCHLAQAWRGAES